jgi:L-Ala-D/L-Glu epimerase
MNVSVHQHTLPLRAPFRTAGWSILEREVLIVRIEDTVSGLSGYGEAAPLKAFGTESFDEAAEALRQFAREYDGSDINLLEFSESCGKLVLDRLRGTPTASCAVETATFDLLARIAGVPLARVLANADVCTSIPVNAILSSGDVQTTLLGAEAALEDGFSCLKLKVGAMPGEDDIERVRAVRELAGPDILIRLDANGAWKLKKAYSMMEKLAPFDIEYIEQPVADIDGMIELRDAEIIPIAADESAQRHSQAESVIMEGAADIVVLKPMAFGGIIQTIALTELASLMGIDVVFTSFIDSAIGRNTVAHICAAMPHLTRHHGLATGALFATDFARDTITGGCFVLSKQSGIGIIPELGAARASA